jgi:hypothetical protein
MLTTPTPPRKGRRLPRRRPPGVPWTRYQRKIIFNYGLGWDSTAILLRWLLEPETRDFQLDQLIVIVAQVGEEFAGTRRLVEQIILPLLTQHRIRTVQVARAGPSDKDGIAVLADTRQPTTLSIEGAWRLGDHLMRDGTAPQYVNGRHFCAQRFKGWPISQWLKRELGDRPYRSIIGYHADEPKRAAKAADYADIQRAHEFPLIAWGWGRDMVMAYVRDTTGEEWEKSCCGFCLAGETEVTTRDGIKHIRDLVGGSHDLLVPIVGKRGGLSQQGGFKHVDVRSFGVQPLWEISLHRGRQRKVVRATAEHRWFVTAGKKWSDAAVYERTTMTLQPGDQLRSLRAMPINKEKLMPFAVAQGFVFGDGARGYGNRPASLNIYAAAKDSAILPFFTGHEIHTKVTQGKEILVIYGLPRFWKELPPIQESRAFLMSWLAGYFAADGSVTKSGQATIESVDYQALEFVRDAASVCGVKYTPIYERYRKGFLDTEGKIYRIGLSVANLPTWFFIIRQHRKRVEARLRGREDLWKVDAITSLNSEEEVFCAVVPGAAAFGLADDLMTGNCPFTNGRAELVARHQREPEQGVRALLLEHLSLSMNPRFGLYPSGKPLRVTLAEAGIVAVLTRFDQLLDETPWALYRVRRIYREMAPLVDRSIDLIATGDRAAMLNHLRSMGPAEGAGGIERVYLRRRPEGLRPSVEAFYVAAPHIVAEKEKKSFPTMWSSRTGEALEIRTGVSQLVMSL